MSVRLDRDLHLNLPTIWPCMWQTLPGPGRTEIINARQALVSSTTLTARSRAWRSADKID